MKLFKILFVLTVLIMMTFVSCVKDNVDDTEVIDKDKIEVVNTTTNNLLLNLRDGSDEGLDLECVTVLYTFEFLMEDGSIVSISSEDEFYQVFLDSMHQIADFVYPLDVLNNDEENVVVNDVIELGELFISCVPDSGWVNNNGHVPAFMMDHSCFDLVFPLNLIDMQGNQIIAQNIEEMIDFMSMHDGLYFDWPLGMMDEEGGMHMSDNSDEFFELMFGCDDFMGMHDSLFNFHDSLYFEVEYLACYELIFPFSVMGSNGEITTIESADELMFQVFGGCNFIEFIYPLNLLNEEGDTITAGNEYELMEMMDDCDHVPNMDMDEMLFYFSTAALADEGCYTINYPIYVSMMHSVSSDEEFAQYFEVHHNMNIQYPVTVTLSGDDSQVVINTLNDLMEIIEDCQ
jgi:hypothetical protein